MPNTYSQITIHAVFAVKQRENYIQTDWRDSLHKYIAGIITNKGAKALAVGGWKDHVHILFGMPVTTNIAELMSAIKEKSRKWINEMQFLKGKYHWQAGYGALYYSKSKRDMVCKDIMSQEEQPQVKSIKDEYVKMLTDFDVSYEDKYLFEFYD